RRLRATRRDILDGLGLIQDNRMPLGLLKDLGFAVQQTVAANDQIARADLLQDRFAITITKEMSIQRRGKLLNFAVPVEGDGSWRDNQRRSTGSSMQQQGQCLERLS